ncbi:ABC transporter permease [Patescibacteria group bacterium]|nr:ABC transporter permease [Patescibacteria group bacterium]
MVVLINKTKTIAGFSLWEVIFFMTFNLVDTAAQFFLREVYRFHWHIVRGDFDYFLTKPISPLLRSLFGGSDIMDLSVFLLSIVLIIVSAFNIGNITLTGILLYIIIPTYFPGREPRAVVNFSIF